jgi:hypothetical protein
MHSIRLCILFNETGVELERKVENFSVRLLSSYSFTSITLFTSIKPPYFCIHILRHCALFGPGAGDLILMNREPIDKEIFMHDVIIKEACPH